jgi:Raf kinase inhibitor-like YbhB/YbcL family protein
MFILTSPVIEDQGIYPDKYTLAKGQNMSPPLKWSGAPKGTKSYAITLVDPDVPWGKFGLPNPGMVPGDLFIHWMLYDIPATVKSLPEGASPKGKLPKGAKQLDNTCLEFGKDSSFYQFRAGYLGSAPPAGDKAHRYLFTAYALNKAALGLPPGARYTDFINAIAGKVVARSSFLCYFGVKA